MKRIRFVDDWRRGWRWFSIHCLWLEAAIQVTWVKIPDEWKTQIPPGWVLTLTAVIAVLGIIGRFIKQEEDNADVHNGPPGQL